MATSLHKFFVPLGLALGRSLCPLFAIVVILGSTLWGPWVSLAITLVATAASLRYW